jgi:quinol monooxygenase YgiN
MSLFNDFLYAENVPEEQSQGERMRQRAMIAEFEVKPSELEKFVTAANHELRQVRENEPGCLRFDVLLFDEKEGTGAFLATFADQSAYDGHRDYSHAKEFFDAIKNIDVIWKVRRGNALS